MHRPGPAAAVWKISKNVIMCILVGAHNKREEPPSFSREEIREIAVLSQISILPPRVLNRQTLRQPAPTSVQQHCPRRIPHDLVILWSGTSRPTAEVFVFNSFQMIFFQCVQSFFFFLNHVKFSYLLHHAASIQLFFRQHLVISFCLPSSKWGAERDHLSAAL